MAERYRKSERRKRIEKKVDIADRKDRRWWLQDVDAGDEPHVTVFENVQSISQRTRARRAQDLYFCCLYDDPELAAVIQGASAVSEFTPQTMASNICRRQVDTFVSRIVKTRPMPMALTTAGNYAQQKRARSLSKFFEGELDLVKFWRTRTLRRRDAGVFGSGLALNYRVKGQRFHDHIFGFDLRVDPIEARYGNPRTIYLRRFMDRQVAKERWPEFAEQIEQAESKSDDDNFGVGYDETCDEILIIQAWHLRSGENASDGAVGLFISNATLEMAEYKRDYFPISKFDYSPPVVGWFGEGMVKQLSGLQFEVNAIGLRLQENAYLTGTYVWAPGDRGIETDTIDNGALTVIRSQAEPKFLTPAPWHTQIFDYYMRLRGQFPGDITGLSAMATRSEKPAGLDSGKAIRAYNEVDDSNLIVQGRADEDDVVDTCWQLLDLAEEIYAEKGTLEVQASSRRFGRDILEDLSFVDVRLDRKQFTLRVFSTSFLASTPEDRWSQVQEMIKAGFLSQDEAMALLDFPDLQRVLNVRGAARRNIERLLEKLVDSKNPEDDYEYPEPAWNLELCKALALMTYLEAKLDGVPEPNLKAILQFATDASEQLNGSAASNEATEDAAQVDAGNAPAPTPGEQYAPPDAQPLPANAVAPEAMAMIPQG